MFWTTIALVMTVMMGGIIAYNGDLIGRKYGKRRVTLFGLRPKYTAILITSVTGVAISGLTTGVLFLLVKPVREVILEGEAAIAARRTWEREKVRTERELASANGKVEEAGRELEALRGQIAPVKQELAQAVAARDQAGRDKRAAEQRLRQAQEALKPIQTRLAAAETRLRETEAKERELTGRNRELAGKNQELSGRNALLAEKNGQLGDINVELAGQQVKLRAEIAKQQKQYDELARSNEDLSNRNIDIVRQNTALTRANEALFRTSDLLRGQTNELEQTRSRLAAENTRLAEDNKALREFVKQIGPEYTSLTDAYVAARYKRVAVHKDEDLGRQVIPANSPPEMVRDLIMGLIHEAGMAAIAKGAAPGKQARAVQVMDRRLESRLTTGELVGVDLFPGDAWVDTVVSRLAWQTDPMAVLAIAVNNTVEAEPAAIDLQPVPNKLIYSRGQTVLTRFVNALQPPERIFRDVVAFLKAAGQSALERGVIPRMDGAGGEPQVGSLDSEEIVKLVDRVRQIGGRARIKAVAKTAIHSADPLELEFQVTQ